ncbi:hypothetical protein VTK26DRAFT_8152 [Humicola hyalothermophila]
MEEAEKLCSTFDATTLLMPLNLLRDYESAAPGSSSFSARLIELLARAIHQFAVWIYVGYWAEARILGGVILFERRKPESVEDAAPDACRSTVHSQSFPVWPVASGSTLSNRSKLQESIVISGNAGSAH